MYLGFLIKLYFDDRGNFSNNIKRSRIFPLKIESLLKTYVTFFFLINIYFTLFFYLWLRWVFVVVRGLFSGCGERGLLFVVVHRLLIVVASLVVEHGL